MGNRKRTPTKQPPVVFVVDDNTLLRESIRAMAISAGFTCMVFDTGTSFITFLGEKQPDEIMTGCLVLDVRMPGINGMDVHSKVRVLQPALPVVFITGHGDIPMAVQAMSQGASGFLEKPFREQELLGKISDAMELSCQQAGTVVLLRRFEACLQQLTPREKQVFDLAMAANTNQQIASYLKISERTVEVHRSNLQQKFSPWSSAEIIRIHTLCIANKAAASA